MTDYAWGLFLGYLAARVVDTLGVTCRQVLVPLWRELHARYAWGHWWDQQSRRRR